MPSRKQQRRRQKLKRHEYEEVYVDEEGNELPPEQAEELAVTSRVSKAERTKERPTSRAGRAIAPPSWRKTFKQGLLFFPLMLITVMLLGKELTLAQQIFQTIVLMGFFLPFSYFMNTMTWRSYQRRAARTDDSKKR